MKSRTRRRRMIRTGTAGGITIALTIALGACAAGGGGAEETTEITIFNRWSDPNSQAAAAELLEGFTAETGIKVKNAVQPNSGSTYQPAVRSALSSSNAPTLATNIAGPELYEFAESGTIADITDFYQEVIAPRASAGASAGLVFEDKNFAISGDTSIGNLVWYNPDYLAQFDIDVADITTFEEWSAAMEKIKDAGGTPIVIGAKDQWPGGHYLNDLVQRAIGSDAAQQLYDRSVLPGQPSSPAWTDPEVVGALETYVSMGGLFQEGFLGEAAATADSLFLGGEVGFYKMGSWFLNTIISTKPDFEPGVMLFPPLEDGAGDGSELTISNSALMVSADADADAAEAFLEYYTRPDVAAKFGAAVGAIMPYELEDGAGEVDPIIQPQWDQILQFNSAASDSSLFNDQGIDVNIYQQYIWQGSVGLMNGDVTPEQLAQQLEDATAAAQKANG